MIWNWRMLMASGEGRFGDVLERALYNGVNSGMSLDGTLYCYRNPLESTGEKIRNPWYDTTCCPPNLERVLASLPGYAYSTSDRGVWVHLYHTSDLAWHLEEGTGLAIQQRTEYPGRTPWTSRFRRPREGIQRVRPNPGWSAQSSVEMNGQPWSGPAKPGEDPGDPPPVGPGDRVHLRLDLRPRLTESNPLVRENTGAGGGRARSAGVLSRAGRPAP